MTLVSDRWSDNPDENQDAPPYGAPENATRVRDLNDIDRVLMASASEHGARLNALGTMSLQNSDDVTITGGNLAADGAGVTNMNASELQSGTVPEERLSGSYPGIISGDSEKFAGLEVAVLTPVKGIIDFYGTAAEVAALAPYWALCDGTNGTPDLREAFVRAASNDNQITGNKVGTGTSTTPSGGSHVHTVGEHAITESEMPSHAHYEGGISRAGLGGTTQGKVPDDPASLLRPGNYQNGDEFQYLTEAAGAGQAHDHPLNGDGTHTHDVPLDDNLTHVYLYKIMRIA